LRQHLVALFQHTEKHNLYQKEKHLFSAPFNSGGKWCLLHLQLVNTHVWSKV